MTTIQAGLTYYKQVNEKVREAAEKDDSITIENVIGQRYIGCGSSGKNITVHGTPGNGLGQYLNGSTLEVFGRMARMRSTPAAMSWETVQSPAA